ncbi:MAG: FAD binding domain-containing protein [Anaerolineales bacterium]
MPEAHTTTFLRPEDLERAWQALSEEGVKAKVAWMSPRPADPRELDLDRWVDLSALALDYIKDEAEELRLGSAFRLAAIHDSEVLRSAFGGILAKAARKTAHQGLRNLATLGAVVEQPDSAPELSAALLACDPELRFYAGSDERVALADYWSPAAGQGLPLELVLNRSQAGAATGSVAWVGRSPMDRAITALAACARIEGGKLSWIRLAVAGDGLRPQRIPSLEKQIIGSKPEDLDRVEIEGAVRQAIEPGPSYRASSEYQKHVAGVLGWRCIRHAIGEVSA